MRSGSRAAAIGWGLDALADAESGRLVGAEVEVVAEHPGKGNSINVGVPVGAEIAYGAVRRKYAFGYQPTLQAF